MLEYDEAYKSGMKQVRESASRKESPYLPVLDEIFPECTKAFSYSIGLRSIPTSFIVGTKTRGRTNAFASNFMPIMSEKTEFADKWSRLCEAQIEEGIHEPVKVYEYKNRYYVEEGNKRVSVLKYFDSPEVYANVTRILPEKSEENAVYYAAMDMADKTGIDYLEFSQAKDYKEFMALIGYGTDTFNEEYTQHLKSVFYNFRNTYLASGLYRLNQTIGDAFLSYIRIFGLSSLDKKTVKEISEDLKKIKEEITLAEQTEKIDVLTEESEPSRHGLLKKLSGKKRVSRVAFIHDKSPAYSGWTYSHELGRTHIEALYDGKLETETHFFAAGDDNAFNLALEHKCQVIITTSPILLPTALKFAVEHPEIQVYNCSLNKSHRYIRCYYARMYEAKFILGALAGTLCDDNKIGYICNYPIYGQIACINAFALGAMMTKPDAKIYLEWSGKSDARVAEDKLFEQGISLLSTEDFSSTRDGSNGKYGLIKRENEGIKRLALPIWDWGRYYEKLIDNINNSISQNDYEASDKAINYYWGMREGVIDIILSDNLPDGARRLVKLLRDAFASGTTPFIGPIKMQSGNSVDGEDHILSIDQIINMDELLENINGYIPSVDELNDTGKSTVEMVGVDKVVEK